MALINCWVPGSLQPEVIGWGVRDGEPYPIYHIAGADGEIEVGDDPEDEGDDGEGDDGEGDDWTPPTREEHERLLADKRRAESEAIERRKWLKEHGINPRTGKKIQSQAAADDDPEDEPDDTQAGGDNKPEGPRVDQTRLKAQLTRATERAQARAEAFYKPVVAELAAKAALADAGWSGKNMDLALRLLDLDEVTVDPDTREILGVEDQIAEIKAEFPDWFTAGRPRRPSRSSRETRGTKGGAAAVDGGDRTGGTPQPPQTTSWVERVSQQLDR